MVDATITTDASELRERLQELSDRAAIADLVSRLGLWLDEHRFDDAPLLFVEDVTVETPGGSRRGIEAITAQARRNHQVPTQHVISNVLIELDGDRADVGANLIVTFAGGLEQNAVAPGLPAVSRALGERYLFEVVRTPRGWRFARIELRVRWTAGEPL
ncbi:MAG TPA: nuclear transport factor 2 family protein [Conexibacter sp.]|nr:nuclear transport factor 2 family protein [Conexibacter sp.]